MPGWWRFFPVLDQVPDFDTDDRHGIDGDTGRADLSSLIERHPAPDTLLDILHGPDHNSAAKFHWRTGRSARAGIMNIKDLELEDLLLLMREHHVQRLRWQDGELSLEVEMAGGSRPAIQPSASGLRQDAAAGASSSFSAAMPAGSSYQLRAPHVGIFHRSPRPGEPPFTEAGKPVRSGDTIAIVEFMKIMHELRAHRDGLLEAFHAEDGATVEFNQLLATIAPPR